MKTWHTGRCCVLALTTAVTLSCGFPALPALEETDASVDAAPDAPINCTANTTTCADATLVACDAAAVPTVSTCGFGCAASGDRCNDLAPSNDLGIYLDQAASASPLVLTGNAIIDTTTQTVTNGDGSTVVVRAAIVNSSPVGTLAISVRSLEAGNVTVRGARALAILVDGDVTLNGTLSLSAALGTPGPGALASPASVCTAGQGTQAPDGTGGGGGGAFGSAGGRGGTGGGGRSGGGGTPNGDATLTPLRGGCPGALAFGVQGPTAEDGRPGAGGGALQLSARGRIRVQPGAFVAANGGGAKGFTGSTNVSCVVFAGQPPACDQGSGGGSGGAILIEASALEMLGTSGLVANGGSGGCGFRLHGNDGMLSASPAQGSNCGNFSGGDGAAGVSPAGVGGSGVSYGGGGGGGAGRIRVNLPPTATFDPDLTIVSPSPAVGTVITR